MMTNEFKRILCPVDFSGHSKEALHYAAAFARASLGKLFLFHAIENPVSGFYMMETAPVLPRLYEQERGMRINIFREAIRRATEMLENFASEATAGCVTEYLVECDEAPHKRIEEIARQEAMDLIVMGTHGRTGFRRMTMGSVAEKVIRTSPCPVLTVHAPQARNKLSEVA